MKRPRRTGASISISPSLSPYLGLICRLDPNLLIAVKSDVLASFYDHGPNAKSGAYAGTHRHANRTADCAADQCTCACRAANLDSILFERAFAHRRAFVINTFDIVAFYGHDLGHRGGKIAPAIVIQNDPVK